MATLLMPPDHHQQQQHQQRRAKKTKNGQKKQPQRGLGVAQLEKLRMQEESKKVMLASSLIAASSSSSPAGAPPAAAPHQLPLVYHPQLQAAVAFQQRGSMNLNAFHPHFLPTLLKAELDHQNHFGFPGSSSPARKQHHQLHHLQQTDSGSCKSGVSSEKHALAGLCSSSPSPCSSQQNNSAPGSEDAGDESSRGSGFFGEPRIKNPGLILSNLISNNTSKEGLVMPPSPADSDLFDPSFRTRKRVYDCRDWPAVYGVPAIKELSSFQIPGNTHPALSPANRTRCCEGPWSGVRDGAADAPVKIIGSTSSPTSFSSWPRSEVCFSFDGTTTKDSCSSSLNLNNNNNNRSYNSTGFRSLEATSPPKPGSDFLALSLATSSHKLVDDRESCSEKLISDQEASGETEEDWSHHLQPSKYMKVIHSGACNSSARVTLELSLNVATADDSSLELKLAL